MPEIVRTRKTRRKTGSEMDVPYDTRYYQKDEKSHYYYAQVISWTECGVCGAILDYEITQQEVKKIIGEIHIIAIAWAAAISLKRSESTST